MFLLWQFPCLCIQRVFFFSCDKLWAIQTFAEFREDGGAGGRGGAYSIIQHRDDQAEHGLVAPRSRTLHNSWQSIAAG